MQVDDYERSNHIHNDNHPKHDDSDINSSFRIETPSPVNVKDLKRQLWNDQEVLQVPSTPVASGDYYYVSDSEYDQHRHRKETQQSPSPVRRSFDHTKTTTRNPAVDPPSIRPPEIQRVAAMETQHHQPAKRSSYQEDTVDQKYDGHSSNAQKLSGTSARRSSSLTSSKYGGERDFSRGRSVEPPRGTSRGRLPSPLIQDRIRSLSQDPSPRQQTIGYEYDHRPSAKQSPHSNDPRDDSFEATIGMFGSEDGSRNTPVGAAYVAAVSHRQQPTVSPRDGNGGTHSQVRETGHVATSAHWQRTDSSGTRTSPQVAHKFIGESPLKHHRNIREHEEQTAPPSPAGNKVKMAQLMAKLNSVNRNNPEIALAEIDKILRQESHMSAPFTSDDQLPKQGDRMDGDNDDDDSDVSSITDPTYQGNSKPYFDRIRVVSPHGDKMPHKRQSPTMEGETPTKLGYNPSTSSFRRPRPSHLQNYAKTPTVSQEPATPAGLNVNHQADVGLRQVADPAPSPSSGSNVFSNSFMENPFDEYASVPDERQEPRDARISREPSPATDFVEHRVSDSKAIDRISSSTEQAKSIPRESPKTTTTSDRPTKPKGGGKSGKLDKFISDKEALANQIRAWDSLSNGVSKSEPKNAKRESQVGFLADQALSLPHPPNHSSRRHPWDGKVPSRMENVNMRDTSMDEAIGIETEMTIRGDYNGTGAVAYRKKVEPRKENESVDAPEPENDHFAAGREIIKNRAEDYLPIDPVYHIDDKIDEEKKVADAEAADIKFPDIPLERMSPPEENEQVPSDINLMRNITKSPDGALQFSPTSQPNPQTQPKAQRIQREAEKEGSSWVAMPATTFFSDFNKTLNPFGESTSANKPTSNEQPLPPSHATRSTARSEETRNRDTNPPTDSSPLFPSMSDLPESKGRIEIAPDTSAAPRVSRSAAKTPRARRDGPPNAGPVDLDDFDDFGNSPLNQSTEQAEIEVSLMEMEANRRSMQSNNTGVAASRSGARSLACHTVGGNKEGQQLSTRDKKKGFLRAFIERKKKKAAAGGATVGHAASAASVTAHSLSLESRGARSVPVTPATPEIRLMAPPPGVMDRRALTPNRGRRGQRSAKNSTNRARSNSLERFRSPSLAKKFNRVMKLYDDET
ncbi:MAG: hypothetical protein SGILL_003724 [Bacillariaceae sp.]